MMTTDLPWILAKLGSWDPQKKNKLIRTDPFSFQANGSLSRRSKLNRKKDDFVRTVSEDFRREKCLMGEGILL